MVLDVRRLSLTKGFLLFIKQALQFVARLIQITRSDCDFFNRLGRPAKALCNIFIVYINLDIDPGVSKCGYG